jgi:hypothetical protein
VFRSKECILKYIAVFWVYFLVIVSQTIFFTCSPSNPYLPSKRIAAVFTAKISGPLYEGTFYKGYLPATDFAVWIEDEQGRFIKTIKISKGVVNVAHAGIHAEHLPTWQKSSKVYSDLTVANDSLSYILPGFDGITSASLKLKANTDTLFSLKWDFTDSAGIPVPEGVYRYCIETSNIRKNTALEVIVLSESTSGTITTRKRSFTVATTTRNIKQFNVSVVPFESDKVPVDAVTSATN